MLKALGQENAKLDAGGLSGAVRIVTANPVLGGLPTYGWQSDLQVGSDGQVVGGSGQLANPVKGADYPVLSADKTLDRLNSRRRPHAGRLPLTPARKDEKGGKRRRDRAVRAGADAGAAAGRGDRRGLRALGAVRGRPAGAGAVVAVHGAPAGRRERSGQRFDGRAPGGGPEVSGAPGRRRRVAQPAGSRPQKPSGKPGAMALESYAVTDGGKKLTVHFWGGVCSTYSVSAEESGTTVKTKVTARTRSRARSA